MNQPTKSIPSAGYTGTANELSNRVLALIPNEPQILMATFSVWDLFDVRGFKCDDLEPSFAQARWALADAKKRWHAAEAARKEATPANGNCPGCGAAVVVGPRGDGFTRWCCGSTIWAGGFGRSQKCWEAAEAAREEADRECDQL